MRKNSGFTLMEISVVLVIITLLISGVILGADLIKETRFKSIWTDSERYIAAVNNFQVKYNALPGDFKEAETYWGSATGCPTGVASVTGTLTCNGDGNGYIGAGTGTQEPYAAWQHLAIAGFIANKNYSPKIPVYAVDYDVGYCIDATDGANCATAIVGIPPTRYYSKAGFNFVAPADSIKWLYYGNIDFGNTFFVGGNATWSEIFSNNELARFDRKFDDGLPFSGRVVTQQNVHMWGWYPCSSGNTYTTGNVRKCPMIIITGF